MAQTKITPLSEEDVLPSVIKAAMGIFAISWLLSLVLLGWRVLPVVYGRDSVPLHYNIYVGIDTFGPWWMLFYIPTLALVIAIGNALLAGTVLKKRPMLALAVWSATACVGMLTLIAIVRIVLINIAYG